MNQRELHQRLRRRPHQVRFEELARLLSLSGFELSTVKGSHHVFRNQAGQHISVPHRVPFVKAAYVRDVLAMTVQEEGYQDD